MASADIHHALLRPAVLQILRAGGFNHARPAVVETVTDLAARYLLLLAASTAQNSFNNHNDFVPTVQDVRLALTEAGALVPQMSAKEEQARGDMEVAGEMVPFEDLRGVEGFVSWAQGPINKEIRRIAGFGSEEMNVEQIAAGTDEKEDYLTAMKKHGKADEDARYHGTILGKDTDVQPVLITGGPVNNLVEWLQARTRSFTSADADADMGATPATSGISSAPLTPIEDDLQTPTET